jgi:hypothetical protein
MHSTSGSDPRAGLATDEAVRRRGYGERGIHRMNEERDGLSSLIGRAGPKQHDRHALTGGDLMHPECENVGLSNPAQRCLQPKGSSQRLRQSSDVQLENRDVLQGERDRVAVPRVIATYRDDATAIVLDHTARAIDTTRTGAPDLLSQVAGLIK